MVNLFIGLVVDAIFTIKARDNEKIENQSIASCDDQELIMQQEIILLKNELKEVKQLMMKIDHKLK
jgi:hypothetical protein